MLIFIQTKSTRKNLLNNYLSVIKILHYLISTNIHQQKKDYTVEVNILKNLY